MSGKREVKRADLDRDYEADIYLQGGGELLVVPRDGSSIVVLRDGDQITIKHDLQVTVGSNPINSHQSTNLTWHAQPQGTQTEYIYLDTGHRLRVQGEDVVAQRRTSKYDSWTNAEYPTSMAAEAYRQGLERGRRD